MATARAIDMLNTRGMMFQIHRSAVIAAITLASFAPTITGCAPTSAPQDTPQIAAPISSADVEARGWKAPVSDELARATGLSYFTVDDDGTTVIVVGFDAEGSELARVTFADGDAGVELTLEERGAEKQLLTVASKSTEDGQYVFGSLDGNEYSYTHAADGTYGDPTGFAGSVNETAALLAGEYAAAVVTNDSLQRARWWSCAKCAAGIAGAAAVAYLVYQSGIGGAVLTALLNAYRFGGAAAMSAVITKYFGDLPKDKLEKLIAAVAALALLGERVIDNCIACVE
jgi:hypothetical protein